MPLRISDSSIINSGIVVDDIKNLYANVLNANTFIEAYPYGGFNYGFVAGGILSSPFTPLTTSRIEKFSLIQDMDGSAIGNLTRSDSGLFGQSSSTHGYTSGGTTIDRFPFATALTSAVSVGVSISVHRGGAGQYSTTYGYLSGGTTYANSFRIERFPFAATTVNSVAVGSLTVSRLEVTGVSSTDYGYTLGGTAPNNDPANPATIYYNIIDRFPFAVDLVNASDVGDLTANAGSVTGISSSLKGYGAGGITSAIFASAVLQSFPFAVATVNATTVANLTEIKARSAGVNSEGYGFIAGKSTTGISQSGAFGSIIEKFSFFADTTSSSIGNLTDPKGHLAGHQG